MKIAVPIVISEFILVAGTIVILLARRKFAYSELREDWEIELAHIDFHTRIWSSVRMDSRIRTYSEQEDLVR